MSITKRALALLVFLLSLVFFAACTYGIVEAWLLRPTITRSTEQALGHLDEVLGVAEKGARDVQSALTKARAKLKDAQTASLKSERLDTPDGLALKLAAWKINNEFASQVSDARATLTSVSQAAIVFNSLVQDFDQAPLGSIPKVDVERLQASTERLSKVGKSAQELSGLLSRPSNQEAPVTAADLASRATPIENTLTEVQAVAADVEAHVTDVRTRVGWIRSGAPNWITWVALAVTGVLFWVAISQVSLMCHSWRWLKGVK